MKEPIFRLSFFSIVLLFSALTPVYAQESTSTTEVLSATDVVISESAPAAPPYTFEGIPGGDGVVGDFVVGPGKVDLTLKPGESKIVQMTVTNRTGERRIFNLTTEDAAGSNDLNTPIVLLGSDQGPFSLKDYISYPHKTFELGQNQRALVPVTISIPANAEPGGLYGSVLVDTVAIKSNEGEVTGSAPQSAIIARVGTLFFITVPGDVERNGSLQAFASIPEKKFYQSGPIHFGLYYKNEGSMHLAPYGEIRISNMLGEEVDYVQLEPWFVLPQSQRLREVIWNREFLFGRYTATAVINRSYDDVIDTLSYSFWVLPWKIVLAAFAVSFFVIFIIRAFFKNFEFKRKK